MTENSSESKSEFKWRHPSEIMKLHQFKKKKKALQARINSTNPTLKPTTKPEALINNVLSEKRKNPFLINSDCKRAKSENIHLDPEESNDQTLFKLLHISQEPKGKANITSFTNILSKIDEPVIKSEIKVIGEKWVPIDWALKTKLRLLSSKPFPWNPKLKISEEASGITAFARCLNMSNCGSNVDTSPNSKFHQCCLYWQHPSLPWMSLFPRTSGKTMNNQNVMTTASIRESMHHAWTDSFRSLFQLIRTRQCPYFYFCSNGFTVLFRAAGVCGFGEMHALVTPTTRGFRQALRQEEIEFTMPLKKKRNSDSGLDTTESTLGEPADEEEEADEEWLQSMGLKSEDIKQINYTQERIVQKAESKVDNSEESLLLVEGLEVQALHSFLVHCKSCVALTGPFAGIPPTLISPVAFNGASLSALKVRESKVHLDNEDYYSLDVSGPILPHVIHNLCAIHPKDNSMTATFSTYIPTMPFSTVFSKDSENAGEGSAVFRQENLSDCGLLPKILKHFCSDDQKIVSHVECLKYTSETNSFAWT